MPRNGSGTYSLPSGNPVSTGTTISSTTHNNTMSDIATALTGSLARNGEATPTANQPMATYKHTGVGNASARDQYAAAGQVQDSSFFWLGTGGGTADVITGSLTPAITAYAAGQSFYFISSGANTTNVTLNINSLGAKAITRNGTTALVAGDIPSGEVVHVVYDGTQFQLQTPKYPPDPIDPDDPMFTLSYTSGNLTVSSAGVNTLAHGMGTMPTLVQLRYKLINAVGNYSAGDEIIICPLHNRADGTPIGWGVLADATNITVRASTSGTLFILDKTTGASTSIAYTDTYLIVRAWA